MKKNSFIHQALWLLCYVSLLLFYVFELSKNDFFKASIQDLEKILGPTTLDIRLFLIIISVVFSVISLLIEYFLSKFLVLLFIQNGTVSFIAGVFHNEKEFEFAKENKFSLLSKKPKSITQNDFLFDLILSSKDSGYFTPVR